MHACNIYKIETNNAILIYNLIVKLYITYSIMCEKVIVTIKNRHGYFNSFKIIFGWLSGSIKL